VIQAHKGSVLGFGLSHDQKLLFSSATDPIINVSISAVSGYTC
jgi:di- and tripeptidase